MTIISPGPRGNFFANARLPGSCVVGVWFDHVHGPNTKSTRIVDTLLMVSSSVRGTLVVIQALTYGRGPPGPVVNSVLRTPDGVVSVRPKAIL